ncbi:Metalloenzyme domain protein, partial [mine drainage metagenome]
LMVTADHATPCVLKGHSSDPVPLLLVGGPSARGRNPEARKFSERSGKEGALGLLTGPEIMGRLARRHDPTHD